MSNQATAGQRFRAALAAEKPLQIIGAINANHALLAKRAGFHQLRRRLVELPGKGDVAERRLAFRPLLVDRSAGNRAEHRQRSGIGEDPLGVCRVGGFALDAVNFHEESHGS